MLSLNDLTLNISITSIILPDARHWNRRDEKKRHIHTGVAEKLLATVPIFIQWHLGGKTVFLFCF